MNKNAKKPLELPLIELSPGDMCLPTVINTINASRYPDLLILARGKLLQEVFVTMKVPGEFEPPVKLYHTGVVAGVIGARDVEPEIILQGGYRAIVSKFIPADADSSYFLSIISGRFEDEPDDIFIDKNGLIVIDPEYGNTHQGILDNLKHRVGNILEMCADKPDINTGLLEMLHDSFDNLDLTRRDVLDQFVWNLIFAVPRIDAISKYTFINSQYLKHRLIACSDLLKRTTERLNADFKLEKTLQRLHQMPRRRNRRLLPGAENKPPIESIPNDDWFQSQDPNLQNKYKMFCEIRDSIQDSREKETFIEAVKRDILELQTFENSGGDGGTQAAITNASLDFVLALPWGKKSEELVDFNEFERVFEGDHYGLDRVKEKVTDFIAVKRSNPLGKSKVLLFDGPPGVGKTSVCMSIAKGLGRKYVRISLGGIRDEAVIRGHRRTYIKALPGCILSELKKAGTKNPVFVLDEIDKVGKDSYHGDPSDALLEVLDPEQNWSFKDNYLEVPFDLSQVLFICTANSTSNILPALLDRMEPIHFSGYTEEAKIQITKKFLIPKSLKDVGLAKDDFELKWAGDSPDEMILKLIRGYTKEGGVRGIERVISNILYRMVKKEQRTPGYIKDVVITDKLIEEVHGIPRYTKARANETKIGEIIGLAWTETGGEILYIQSAIIPKQGDTVLSQTGQLGSVMREADKLALSLQRIRLEKIDKTGLIDHKLIHLHIPQGAIPKDGPSAGITACFSLESAIDKKVARQKLAMTGEITLSGMVTAVGGIKEKVIAAANAGIEILILPKTNEKDYLEEVPNSAKIKFKEIHFVESVDEARPFVFEENQPA